MVKRRDVDELRPPLVSGLTQRCLFIAALVVGLLIVINQAFSRPRTNGTCGSAEGVATGTSPTSGLCSSGSATSVSGGGGSPWIWSCLGSGPHHTNASCSAPFQVAAVNGVCGPANGVPSATAPTAGLCSAGNATPVASNGTTWAWTCQGTNDGTTAPCSAPVQTGGGGGGTSAQKPGPSSDLFNGPYYKCVNNFYVATTGNDANNGSQSAPWGTLQHADSADVGAGSCINVAPGTYNGLTVTHGGNAATSTGYVVYRCQTLDGCLVTGNAGVNGNASFETAQSGSIPNYIQVDGFEMTNPVNDNFAVGFNVYNGGGSNAASHHIWSLNNIIHGFSQSGFSGGGSEYMYVIHNTLYDNSRSNSANCGAQGSGISEYEPLTIPGYTPTADDKANPNSLLGPTWTVGSDFFRFVYEYNVVYNNGITGCGTVSNPINTDGNGIIFDTFLGGSGGNPENYTSPGIAAFNVVYNNGGSGIHVFGAANVTVANNTCYNNQLDPANNGTFRACMDSYGYNNNFVNNIVVMIPAPATNCNNDSPPYAKFITDIEGQPIGSPADSFSNNLTDMIGVGCNPEVMPQNGDVYNAPPNIESTNPDWVNVGTTSVGTESTPPVGANFALSPGSPAIGKGLTEPYLPPSSVDLGACASSLATCP